MSALMDALTWTGEALSKPGRAVRGAIAGRPDELLSFVPFSDTMGLTDPSRAVWGRDLLRDWGVGTGSETGDTVAGIGVDLLTDPLLYFGGGLARGAMGSFRGSRALGVGAGEDAGAAIGRLAQPPAAPPPLLFGQGHDPAVVAQARRALWERGSTGDWEAVRDWRRLMEQENALLNEQMARMAAQEAEVARLDENFAAAARAGAPAGQSVEVTPLGWHNPNAVAPQGAAGGELSRLLREADAFAPPPAYAASADELFGFPFSGRAADPYGHGSLFHDMLAEGVSPLERQSAIMSAWDEALGRVPRRPVEAELAFDFNPDASPGEMFGVADDWAAQFDNPLLARLAEGRAFEEAARAGMYGPAAEGSPLLQALRGQLEAIEGLTGRAVTDVRDAAQLVPHDSPVAAIRSLLADDMTPSYLGLAAVDPARAAPLQRAAADLLSHPSLAPELSVAKRATGNVKAEQARENLMSHLDFLRDEPVNVGSYANQFLSDFSRFNPDALSAIKGAARQYDDVGPMLQELYGLAGQTPPKWAMPKAPPPAPLPEAPAGPVQLTREEAMRHLPRGYEPPELPAGVTTADIPTETQVGLPRDHPDYRFAWLRAARQNSARRRHITSL